MATTLVPVEVYHDPEVGTWHFHIANPSVVGGGQATKEEAVKAAAEALAFALEPDGEPVADLDGVIELLEVMVRPTK